VLRRSGAPLEVVEALSTKVMILNLGGRFREGVTLLEEALDICRTAGNRMYEGDMLQMLGVLLSGVPDLPRARDTVVEGVRLHRALGYASACSPWTSSSDSCWPANDRPGRSSAVADERTATAGPPRAR